MTRSLLFLALFGPLALGACGKETSRALPDTDEARLGYALGQRIGRDLVEQGATIDVDALERGLGDGLADREASLEEERLAEVLGQLKQEIVADHPDEAFAGRRRRPEEAPFLAANAGRNGVRVLESGVQIEMKSEGTGASPTMDDSVRIRYRTTTPSGKVVRDCLNGDPEVHSMKNVPAGMSEALMEMKEGGTAYVVVPSHLAYTQFKMGPLSRRAIAVDVELVGVDRGNP